MAYTHIPTGKSCTILIREAGRAFCNFGAMTNPFTWVKNEELRDTCGLCGDAKPIDRSCDCFDNGCQ